MSKKEQVKITDLTATQISVNYLVGVKITVVFAIESNGKNRNRFCTNLMFLLAKLIMVGGEKKTTLVIHQVCDK